MKDWGKRLEMKENKGKKKKGKMEREEQAGIKNKNKYVRKKK